jgi:mRNA interferase MazF
MANLYERGLLVLVPFPFTDLSQSKQRPAVVVSPSNFSGDNIIVCAVSSKTSSVLKSWEVSLNSDETQNERLPKASVVKVDRLFTIHQSLVIKVLDKLTSKKSAEVMKLLEQLLS